MKLLRLFAVIAAACAVTFSASAAEATPTGTWRWTVQGRQGGQGFEQTLKLELKDGKLTGTMLGREAGRFSVPDTPITEAVFENGTVRFAVTREFQGNKFTTRYEGRLEGDTIRGTYETAGVAGRGPTKREWEARRVAAK